MENIISLLKDINKTDSNLYLLSLNDKETNLSIRDLAIKYLIDFFSYFEPPKKFKLLSTLSYSEENIKSVIYLLSEIDDSLLDIFNNLIKQSFPFDNEIKYNFNKFNILVNYYDINVKLLFDFYGFRLIYIQIDNEEPEPETEPLEPLHLIFLIIKKLNDSNLYSLINSFYRILLKLLKDICNDLPDTIFIKKIENNSFISLKKIIINNLENINKSKFATMYFNADVSISLRDGYYHKLFLLIYDFLI